MTLAGLGNDLGLLLASGGIHTANRQGVLVAVHPDEHGAPFTWACGDKPSGAQPCLGIAKLLSSDPLDLNSPRGALIRLVPHQETFALSQPYSPS